MSWLSRSQQGVPLTLVCRFQLLGVPQTIKFYFCFKVQNFYSALSLYLKLKIVLGAAEYLSLRGTPGYLK